MGTLNKLKAKTAIKTEQTKKEHEKVIEETSKTTNKKQKGIRTAADLMRNTIFSGCSLVYIPKHKKRK